MGESKRPWWMPEGSIGAGFWEAQENINKIREQIVEEIKEDVMEKIYADTEAKVQDGMMPADEEEPMEIEDVYHGWELSYFARYILEDGCDLLLGKMDIKHGSMGYDALQILSKHPESEVRLAVAQNPSTDVCFLGRLTQDKNSEVAEAALQALTERRNK